jgi:low temperature requirement protein LtrA
VDATAAHPEAEDAGFEESEQRVTPLELFFDLVFVFAFTQVTSLMAETPTWEGLGQGMLVLGAVWWAWSAYGWLTNEVDPEQTTARLNVFAAMGAMLIASLAIPGAFGADALAFGISYFIVRALHILLFATASEHVGVREAILRLAPTAIGGPALIIVAAAFDGTAQAALWVLALVLDYGAPIVRGVEGFSVSAGHFAERFGLIIIIALGESIVAVGVATSGELDAATIAGATAGVVIAAALWWIYFDVVAVLTERRLREAQGGARNRMARDVYSYLHLPMIAGIVLVALGIKKVLLKTDAPLDTVPAVALLGGVALYLLAHVAIRLRNVHTIAWRRVAAAAICVALIPLAADEIDALAAIAVLGVVVSSLVVLDTRSYGDARARVRAATHPS